MSYIKLLLMVLCLVMTAGCAQRLAEVVVASHDVPVIRVRIMQNYREVNLSATSPLLVKTDADLSPHRILGLPASGILITLNNGNWDIGGRLQGTGELIITPEEIGGAAINGKAYRGRFRLVPVSNTHFDVVNDVDIDGYLKSVVSAELFAGWHDQAYKAQAVAARTYALFEARTVGVNRFWDVFADERSQVYIGLRGETAKSVRTVNATAGIVLAFGPAGNERIFKAYYSSTCGGVGQSSYDAFGDRYTPVLGVQNRGDTCSPASRFRWGPVTISKDEIARRISIWAKRRSEFQGRPRPELALNGIARIDQAYLNKYGRPTMYFITDNSNNRIHIRAEELRHAINTDATRGTTLFSSSFLPVNEANSIRFTEGRGFGHGVGLCQWCAQQQALAGWQYQAILQSAYPGSKLIRDY